MHGNPFANGVYLKTAGKVKRKKNILMNRHEKKANGFVYGIREHGKYLFIFHQPYPARSQDDNTHKDLTSGFFFYGITVRLGPKILETVKEKLSLGARILQLGGVKRVFKQLFGVGEGETLLKASQCYLSTTAGPIAGLLFISTQRVSFCSDRSIKFSSPNGELVRFHYKVG